MELTIGKKIRTLRRQKNISQEVLAQYLGVSFQAVSKWENGISDPSTSNLIALAKLYGLSAEELLEGL